MGCFFTACFGPRKRSKTRRRSRSTTTANLIQDQQNIICHDHRQINQVLQCLYSTHEEEEVSDPVAITSAIIKKDAAEEEELKSNERKKVAYHYDMMLKNSSKKELNPLVESDMGHEETRKATFFPDSIEKFVPAKCKDDDAAAADSSSGSSLFTYPTNHRYHNCTTSDDESEVTGLEKSDLADEFHGENVDTIDKGNDDHPGSPFDGENIDSIGEGSPFDGENADIGDRVDKGNNDHKGRPFDGVHADIDGIGEGKNDHQCQPFVQEESSESLFSLSIDSRKKIFAAEIGEKEVSSPFKLPSIEMNHQNARSIHSVLNPIENMSQWRALKENTVSSSSLKDQEKENKNLEQETEFSSTDNDFHTEESKQQSMRQTPKEDEIAVNTSFSSWLMASGKSKTNENSPVSVGNSSKRTNSSSRSFDDRPILGALTLDELKQLSRFSAPRHSPNRSPEDTPITGTVGSYWMHTGQCIELNSNTPSRKISSKPGQYIEPNSNTPSRKTSSKSGQCIEPNSNTPSRKISSKSGQCKELNSNTPSRKTSSKSGQCKEGRMKGHSTTSFQARLERTLNSGSAEA